MDFENSRTKANLMSAFAGESQARNKYTFYAKKAKKDGYEQIHNIFEQTASNEMAHASLWFKYLHGGSVPDTLANLADAAAGEHFEWTQMYKEFAEVAHQEGFDEIAKTMELIAEVEHRHEERFKALAENIRSGKVFKKDSQVSWECLNCGHIHNGNDAPNICPAFRHPESFFEVKSDNF